MRLARSLTDSVHAEVATRKRFEEVRSTFTSEVVSRWDEMVVEWEEDARKPNPYVDSEERGASLRCPALNFSR